MSKRPCASGAHFHGNCQCIGDRGLRHRREDLKMEIIREWGWYYRIYGDDPPLTYEQLTQWIKS